MITEQQIVSTILGSIEPTEPVDTIFRVLQENEGKRLDERLINKIRQATGDDSVRKSSDFGMARIIWKSSPSGFLCAYAEKNVYIDSSWIKEHNTWAFEARDKRNINRKKDLENLEAIKELADSVNALKVAKVRYELALESFEDSIGLDSMMGGKKNVE